MASLCFPAGGRTGLSARPAEKADNGDRPRFASRRRRYKVTSAIGSFAGESGAPGRFILRGSMPPADENARCVRAKANDHRDGPWESAVEACTFGAGGLAQSGKPRWRPRSPRG